MRTVAPAVLAGIKSGKIANIIKVTLKDGTVLGYTDFQMKIQGVGDGVTYIPAPGLQKMSMVLTNNAEVSNQEFAAAWIDVPETDLKAGRYDDATIEVAWVGWQNPSAGKLTTFIGTLGTISWTEDGFRADVQSQMRDLGMNIGTTVTAACRHQLYSQPSPMTVGACTLNKANYTFTGSVATVVTSKFKFTTTTLNQASGYFNNGVLKFTSGKNAGLSVEIKEHTVSGSTATFTVFLPTAFQFVAGDTFQIIAGCDKSNTTCKAKFNNMVNFGGFPHIKPEVNTQ